MDAGGALGADATAIGRALRKLVLAAPEGC
jgi:hypothetical protein